jgi:hypothetical protein
MRRFSVGLTLLFLSSLTYGHHSTLGFFDPDQFSEIEGVVTSIRWRNPHITFTVDVTDASGETVEWAIESTALSVLRTKGLDQGFMEVGDRVGVAGYPSRRGLPELSGRNILLADGTEVLVATTAQAYFSDPSSDQILDPVYSSDVAAAARESARGIYRVWSTVLTDRASFPMFKGDYPLTESAAAARAAWNPAAEEMLKCWEKGMPLLMITPVPIEFQRSGDDIRIRFEEDDAERLIHMNADDAASPIGPTRLGYSRGRWEGSTLIVETTHINAPEFDDRGAPQSPDVSLVERFTLSADEQRLDYRILITDPATFTRPFELTRYWVWRPEIVVQRWDCQDPD